MHIEINRLHAAKGVTSLATAWDCEDPATTEEAQRFGLALAINFYPSSLPVLARMTWDLMRCFDKQLQRGERPLVYSFELQELIECEDDLYAETVLMMCGLIRSSQFAFIGSGCGSLKKIEVTELW